MVESTELVNPILNPTPLGLFEFAVTTILLSLCNLGVLDLSMVIIAVAIVLGSFAEIIAGPHELKFGNTFAGNVFVSFGLFWLSLVLILLLPQIAGITVADNIGIGVYLLIFGIFSLLLFISTLKSIPSLKVLFLFVTLLFLSLSVTCITGIALITSIGGLVGVITGPIGIYVSAGMIINDGWKRDIFKL